MGRRRCDRRRFGGLSLMVDGPITIGLPAMHPGELLREYVMPALGRTRAEIARLLGVSRQTLHAILTERAPVTPEMASPSRFSSNLSKSRNGCRQPWPSGREYCWHRSKTIILGSIPLFDCL